jgi:hypothetical protein
VGGRVGACCWEVVWVGGLKRDFDERIMKKLFWICW